MVNPILLNLYHSLRILSINTQDDNFFRIYITSCYSLVETLTTVGYGDVVCQSTIERIFQIIFLTVGVIAYSYLISSFGNLIKNESQSSIKYNNKMKILEEIRVDYPNMPFKLYNKMYNYIESRNIAEKKLDANYLTNSLPFNLRNALLLVMYSSCIRNFKLFKNCENSNFIIQILSKFVPSTSKKAEILVYEGEMIEEIIIVKDGRLSLEAAIDTENPESSIRQYFNVNFAGITTAKEMKKLAESKKTNTSQLITSKKTKDFDKAKSVLNIVLKKQTNNLFNEGTCDSSILDKTKIDLKNENPNNKMKYTVTNYLNHEPIKNEKGNYKYIKIIDIIKNENFGGLYMFMRRPSPLSLKVKSKFADLYLIPKKDIFEIAKNYINIWKKIHKKDFHNMLSIKHKTFNILNKYIEINGIGKITPNDVSRFVYAWEDKAKVETTDNINNEQLNNISPLNFNNQQNVCPSPINPKGNALPNFSFKLNFSNKNLVQNSFRPKVVSTKSLDIINQQDANNQHFPSEKDFSQLLAIMANSKKNLNTNSNSKINLKTNSNNNLNTNNFFNPNSNANINTNTNINKENNEQKSSHRSFVSNLFNDKKITNHSIDDAETIIITHEKETMQPATLNHVFTENKAKKIKEIMKQSKKKENKRKIFSLGKKTAKLFKNYNILLLNKDKNQNKENYFEIKNKISSSSLIRDINSSIMTSNQSKIFLEQIPEISSDEEYSLHQFEKRDLVLEEVISFSLNSIYQNINSYTNLEYSKNKNFQEKTLKYINKLIENKNKSKISSSLIDKNHKLSLFSKSQDSSFDDDIIKLSIGLNSNVKSERLYDIKKHNMKKKKNKNNNNLLNIENLFFSGEKEQELKKNTHVFNSLEPRKSGQICDIDNKSKSPRKTKKLTKIRKSDIKFTFKIENNSNDNNINEDQNILKEKKSIKHSSLCEENNSKNNNKVIPFSQNEVSSSHKNIKNSKTTKNFRNKRKLSLEKREKTKFNLSKRKSNPTYKCKSDIEAKQNENREEAKFDYFEKEEKEGCKIA